MVDQIPWAAIGALTPSGMLMLAVWLILTGRIVPKSTYDVMVKARDDWQATALKNAETVSVQALTIEKQTVIGDSVNKVMGAVQEARESGKP